MLLLFRFLRNITLLFWLQWWAVYIVAILSNQSKVCNWQCEHVLRGQTNWWRRIVQIPLKLLPRTKKEIKMYTDWKFWWLRDSKLDSNNVVWENAKLFLSVWSCNVNMAEKNLPNFSASQQMCHYNCCLLRK